MGILNIKQSAEELNQIADGNSHLVSIHLEPMKLASWCAMHGWDGASESTHLLIARQATLLALIKKLLPNVEFLPTPLDVFDRFLESQLEMKNIADVSIQFNYWGELYNALIPQPERRRIGQFWTNELIADWMTAWLLRFNPRKIADVGCGSGNFLCRATQLIEQRHIATSLYGCDVSPLMLNIAIANLEARHLRLPRLAAEDYLSNSLPVDTDAVICNPPYTRHHHIAPVLKDKLQWFFKSRFHLTVSRQATMASYFLLKLIAEMPEDGRAAIILPMEVLDARYGNTTKQILARETKLDAIIHFDPNMNAFAKVDVGASILLFQKRPHQNDNQVKHLTLRALPTTEQLLETLNGSNDEHVEFGSLVVQPQSELTQVSKWFAVTSHSEPEKWEENGQVVPLKELATIMRGIATGANNFFALSTPDVEKLSLKPFVVPTTQRNREIQDIVLDHAHWKKLSDEGKRVWLLYLTGEDVSKHSSLRHYIANGEAEGFHRRALVGTRKRWYMMEQRRVPPIFFTILTRGNPRFILNQASVRPLNMFSLVYPARQIIENDCIEMLWALLNSDFSISKLHSVSRTYGGNTLKVEPRELDNLPVINPLSLSDDDRKRLTSFIKEFETHRNTRAFIAKVNSFVENFLQSGIPVAKIAVRPKQLALLESRMQYHTQQRKSRKGKNK